MGRLRFDALTKRFPGVLALDGVCFGVEAGSVHALCGENGAGKSTLLKILSGVYRADGGQVLLDEAPTHFASPVDAIRAGVAVIYQELHLVPELSVAENVLLGHLPATAGWVNGSTLVARTRKILEEVGVDLDPGARVGTLSLAQRQMVEIAKALSREASVIAFDEPTSSLSAREVETLFALIRDLKARGKAILYVSHRLDEIFALCDAGTVLRDGRHVETFPALSATTPAALIQRMVGRDLADIYGYTPRPSGELALDSHGVQIRRGEIVGLFGLVGAGRTELLRALYGHPRAAIRAGVMLCPEDRKKEGIIPARSVAENINLSVRRRLARLGFWVDERAERENARRQVEALKVRTPSLSQEIRLLSGGNQQKVILARWLSEEVRVLLLDEPTRGVDIGAKREIYDIIYALARRGVAILMVSSELPEVLGVCDRVLVLRQGRIVADLAREEATPEVCLAQALPVAEAA